VGIIAGIILEDINHPLNKAWLLASLGLSTSMVFVSGPAITGAIIDKAPWRWIFYVNIPIGSAVILAMLLFFEAPERDL
jgi:MFS family permease